MSILSLGTPGTSNYGAHGTSRSLTVAIRDTMCAVIRGTWGQNLGPKFSSLELELELIGGDRKKASREASVSRMHKVIGLLGSNIVLLILFHAHTPAQEEVVVDFCRKICSQDL